MNCIPASRISPEYSRCVASRYKAALALCLVLITAVNASAAGPGRPDRSLQYDIDYFVSLDQPGDTIRVELRLDQSNRLLREVVMRPNFERHSDFQGDGDIEIDERQIRWTPPASGGVLRWQVHVNHLRNDSGYDAWLGPDWGVFRAEDLLPRARTRVLKGASSKTRLHFDLPPAWNVVTQYYGQQGQYEIDNPDRQFDEPSGWIVIGRIGVRRETVSGTRVAIAGPVENSVRRLDTLALLNWTLPELSRLFGFLPPRLTIISAGEPMWRGGLSAPQSLFIHADRPLISENATSTLLHEVMHIALGVAATTGYDWIVEGLAEYYSIELLARSGTITENRHQQAMEQQKSWARDADDLCTRSSTAATTAFAVTTFARLDKELRAATDGKVNLDDVTRAIADQKHAVNLDVLNDIVSKLTFDKPDALRIENLPGCRNMAAGT